MRKMPGKPKTRKTPAAKAPKAAPEMEFDMLGRGIVEAQDILNEAAKLADAVSLIALELGEYECGAICSVADAIKAKINDGLGLIEAYRKESGLATRQVEAARKAMGHA
jgi:hypothetical protein